MCFSSASSRLMYLKISLYVFQFSQFTPHVFKDISIYVSVQPILASWQADILTSALPQKYVPVGTVVRYTATFSQGDMLTMTVNFRDGTTTSVMLNPSNPGAQFTYDIDHKFSEVSQFFILKSHVLSIDQYAN